MNTKDLYLLRYILVLITTVLLVFKSKPQLKKKKMRVLFHYFNFCIYNKCDCGIMTPRTKSTVA